MKELFLKLISMFSPAKLNPAPLPVRFLNLKLVKRLSRSSSKFVIGLYSNRHGQKFVAKFWSGDKPDTSYYLLQREINFLKFVKTHLTHTDQFLFPVFVRNYEEPNQLVLVTKYFSGRRGGDYDTAINYLRRLPSGLPIPTRSQFYFIAVYPLIFVVAVLRQRGQFYLFARSLFAYFSRSLALFKNYKLTFVHGDLHPRNLLTRGEKTLILDVEQAMYTYPEFELATTISSANVPDHEKKRLLNKIQTGHWPLFSVLGIFCATYNLGVRSTPPQEQSFYNLLSICSK